jgi:hypothetical protein
VTWEELFDWFFFGFVQSGALRSPTTPTAELRMNDIPFYSCGGDTSGPVDDRVSFKTDLGLLSVASVGDIGSLAVAAAPAGPPTYRPFATISPGCDAGDSVDVRDHPGPVADTRGYPVAIEPLPPDWCDLDFAPNGVVTYALWGAGESGVATITAEQSGGGVLRSSNLTLTGLAAAILFVEAPDVIGIGGGELSVAVVDDGLRPLGGQTVSCTAEPKDAVLAIIPQTGTTGSLQSDNPGQVSLALFPTRSAAATGVEVTLTCFVDSNPDVSAIATVLIGAPEETVNLLAGCNFETWTGDEIDPADLAELVAPAENLAALWAQQPFPMWKGFAPGFPEVSDMGQLNRLDIVAICMTGRGTLTRPAL